MNTERCKLLLKITTGIFVSKIWCSDPVWMTTRREWLLCHESGTVAPCENVLSGDANKLSGAGRRELVFVGVQTLREVSSGKFRTSYKEGMIPPRRN